ncbi:hypothetical protein [Geodermatophilus sp. URMC 64]
MFSLVERAVLDATLPVESSEADSAVAAGDGPSNQQILDAAKAAYASYQPAVDATTLALVASLKDAALAQPITVLDGTNWSSPGLNGALAAPFFTSTDVATALGVVRKTDLKTFSVGVFTAQVPGGGPGMVGFSEDVLGLSSYGLTLTLNVFSHIVSVDPRHNLQYGVWLPAPDQLHDLVLGFYANASLQDIGVNLKILLTKALQPYGFVTSAGASLPVSSGVFAGATAQWIPAGREVTLGGRH